MEGPVAARNFLLFLGIVLATLLLPGCGHPPPLYAPRYHGPTPPFYHVRPGDTLYSIGQRFGVDHQRIARWNDINNPSDLHLGQRLRLRPPDGAQTAAADRGRPSGEASAAAGTDGADVEAKARPRAGKVAVSGGGGGSAGGGADTGEAPGRWRWPVAGEVIRGFSSGSRQRSNGIDIAAPAGSEVRAAAAGKVVYSGDGLRGYGNLVIIRHSGSYLTTYAYNRENLVAEDERVEAGQVVARVGETGAAERALLHFEVRRRTQPIDPMRVLPDR